MSKVIAFGLDGCTYSIVKTLRKEIPFFDKLMSEGRYGEMITQPPANTTIGWSSWYTGKNPGKTGVFNKTQGNATLQAFQQSRNGVKADAIWDIIGREDLKSIVFNIPVTYPALPLNGILISSFDSVGDAWTYPYDLKEKIEPYWSPNESPLSEYIDPQNLFDDLWNKVVDNITISVSLMDQFEWDFAAIGFLGIDRISHAFMNKKSPTFQLMVKDIYKQIGKACMEIWKRYNDEDLSVVVFCDHGMRQTDAGFFINSYLYNSAQLFLKDNKPLDIYGKIQSLSNVDFEHSDAWTSGLGGITVKDQHDSGDIQKYLEEFIDPRTEKKVFDKVLHRNQVWSGKHLEDMPELLAFPAEGYEVHWTNITNMLMKTNEGYSDHDLKNGFYAVHGLDNKEDEVNILDIAPTILKKLGIKVPKDFDGKALT